MELRLYLKKNRLTVNEFCEKVNYSRTHVSAVINKRFRPSKKLAKLIEQATNGEVTMEEILESTNKTKIDP